MAIKPPILTLITDFGLKDEYVGVVKGVVLTFAPTAQIVDITHLIPPQRIQTASHLLARAYSYFPPGSVHLVIVDPGVGSSRSILAVAADSHYFIGPDNGVFTHLFLHARSLAIHRVTASQFFLKSVGTTFHGRDIMAPVAARLATGLAIDRVGPPIAAAECVHTLQGTIAHLGDMLQGEISHVDSFGNLCTNLSRQEVENFAAGKEVFVSTRGNDTLRIPLYRSYADQDMGKLLALYDSHDFLEIAVNQGNAAQELNLAIGSFIFVSMF